MCFERWRAVAYASTQAAAVESACIWSCAFAAASWLGRRSLGGARGAEGGMGGGGVQRALVLRR